LRFKDPSTQHFSVCPQCVVEDAELYLRLEWTLGWIAVSPQHALVLADSLLMIFWVVITESDHHHLLSWIQYDLCLPLSKDHGRWHEGYESLAILIWLLEVPRHNTGVRVTVDDLSHWMARHAFPALNVEGRALLQMATIPAPLQDRLKDLISMLTPFRYVGQFALRSTASQPVRYLGRSQPSSGI
jgi:hypothetical protein